MLFLLIFLKCFIWLLYAIRDWCALQYRYLEYTFLNSYSNKYIAIDDCLSPLQTAAVPYEKTNRVNWIITSGKANKPPLALYHCQRCAANKTFLKSGWGCKACNICVSFSKVEFLPSITTNNTFVRLSYFEVYCYKCFLTKWRS